jgi:hypothetical protein
METYKLFPTTGNKEADYLVNKHAPDYVNTLLGSIISTPWYMGLPKSSQKIVLKKRLQQVRKMVKGIAEGEALVRSLKAGKKFSVFDKGKWTRLPSAQKRLADEYFKQYYGGSVSQLGAYKAAITIGRALEKAL